MESTWNYLWNFIHVSTENWSILKIPIKVSDNLFPSIKKRYQYYISFRRGDIRAVFLIYLSGKEFALYSSKHIILDNHIFFYSTI